MAQQVVRLDHLGPRRVPRAAGAGRPGSPHALYRGPGERRAAGALPRGGTQGRAGHPAPLRRRRLCRRTRQGSDHPRRHRRLGAGHAAPCQVRVPASHVCDRRRAHRGGAQRNRPGVAARRPRGHRETARRAPTPVRRGVGPRQRSPLSRRGKRRVHRGGTAGPPRRTVRVPNASTTAGRRHRQSGSRAASP